MNFFPLIRPLIHSLPPETAHALALAAAHFLPAPTLPPLPSLAVNAFGLHFAHPLGLAAGFDKNATAVDALLARGFGFVEAGTVTPKPQPGNPPPRLFRLSADGAVINRMGFNNEGLEAFVRRLSQRDRSRGIVGANIGRNKDAASQIADYITGMQAVYAHADYITINISSPNTQGLRDLQKGDALIQMLGVLQRARAECVKTQGRHVPVLLKVAPDLTPQEKADIAQAVLAHGIDGLIVSNTTITRPSSLKSQWTSEQGGLSGRPLFALSTEALRDFYRITGGRLPLIGVGGIFTADDAYAKIRAGATLVQLYTALVYRGFGVVSEILTGLAKRLERDGFSHIGQAVGADSRR